MHFSDNADWLTSTPRVTLSDMSIPARIIARLDEVLIGYNNVKMALLITLVAGGHLLLEGPPGTGKTLLCKTMQSIIGETTFHRIQFTPDLLPADIVGSTVYDSETKTFRFEKGPIFANVVLADEINRGTPRTHSALLEAMEEGFVTVDGKSYELPQPFFIVASMNPIDLLGTQPIDLANLDRFLFRAVMDYPDEQQELRMVASARTRQAATNPKSAITADELFMLREQARALEMVARADPTLCSYVVRLAQATRPGSDWFAKVRSNADESYEGKIISGISPRATERLMQASGALALIYKSSKVQIEHIRQVFPFIASHRIQASVLDLADNSELIPEFLLDILNSIR